MFKIRCTHLVDSKYCDGSVRGKLDAPVLDQIRIHNSSFKHVLDSRTISLLTVFNSDQINKCQHNNLWLRL